ncbi:MAG: helix-turn-helix domain-containing protein [bacterium]
MENAALRHQLKVYKRKDRKPEIKPTNRIFRSLLSQIWSGWEDALYFIKPATVISWRRKKFREHWTKLCRNDKLGRPSVDRKIISLIRDMSKANPIWRSPHRDELRKVGIDLAKSTIEKYMVKHRKPPSPTWRAFWDNRAKDLVPSDFFVVPTIRNIVLFVFLALA